MSSNVIRLPEPEDLTLAVLDVQEKLIVAIHDRDDVLKHCVALSRGVDILGGRVVVTEQYAKGLGPTVEALRGAISQFAPIEKRAFSACGCDEFVEAIGSPREGQMLLIAGIETHVCVLQTVLDTLETGWRVGVVADAVGSRSAFNRNMALKRMARLGVSLLTTEMVLFELMRTSRHPKFKDILALVK